MTKTFSDRASRNERLAIWAKSLRTVQAFVLGVFTIASLTPAAADDYREGSGDEFIVVDCLLPGQVRRLGNRTYVSRRKPIMATAKDCHVRGGEYILDDRASVAGSIQAWLPAAMDGDAVAQNYIGELSERGEKGVPDYAMARIWYDRSAQQGHNPARFNLARLYEEGLGGPVEPEKAEALYRAAYGFDGDLASAVRLVDPAEIAALKSEIAARDETIAEREAEIARLREELETRAETSAALETERQVALQRIAALESDLASQRVALSQTLAAEAGRSAGSDAAYAELQTARTDLQRQQVELDARSRQIAAQEAALAEQMRRLTAAQNADTADLSRLEAQLSEARAALASEQRARMQAVSARDAALSDLAASRAQLDSRLQQLAAQEAALSDREAALASTREDGAVIAAERAALDAERRRLADARSALSADTAAFEARRLDLETRLADVASAEARLEARRSELTAREAAFDARAASLGSLSVERDALAAERAAFEQDRASVDAATASYEARLTALSQREAAASQRLADLDTRAAAVSVREAELEKREREAQAAKQAAETALGQLAALREQIELAQQTLGGGQRSLVPSSASITPKPLREQFRVKFGEYHALLIGNENYEHADWPDLDTSHNDVAAIGAILEDKYGFRVTILKDATRFEILKALSDLGDQLGENDNLLLYFAGHGQYIDQIASGYWEPVDSIPYKTVNSISVQDVNTQLSLTKARKVLVVSDSCYSGAFTRAPFAMLKGDAAHETRERYLQQIADKRSRNVMTAGGLQPVADGLGNGHSLFARAFISALVDNDDVALGRDVFSRVRDVVTVSATAMNWEQEPEYDEIVHSGHEGGDFIFVPLAP